MISKNKIAQTLAALVITVSPIGCTNLQNSADLQGKIIDNEPHLTEYGKLVKKTMADHNIYATDTTDYWNRNIRKQYMDEKIKQIEKQKPKLHIYHEWADENKNYLREESELRGLKDKSFNLGETISLGFANKGYLGNLDLEIRSQEKLIDEKHYSIDQPNQITPTFLQNYPEGIYTISTTFRGNEFRDKIVFVK